MSQTPTARPCALYRCLCRNAIFLPRSAIGVSGSHGIQPSAVYGPHDGLHQTTTLTVHKESGHQGAQGPLRNERRTRGHCHDRARTRTRCASRRATRSWMTHLDHGRGHAAIAGEPSLENRSQTSGGTRHHEQEGQDPALAYRSGHRAQHGCEVRRRQARRAQARNGNLTQTRRVVPTRGGVGPSGTRRTCRSQ